MRRALLAALLSCLVCLHPPVTAQVQPIYDRGAAGLTQTLQRLTTTASVLHVGAHPDDEDSAFLARAARGDHARVAYLSLNRGEGGQNLLGPELFDALGVIRTEELLQARRLDGAQQFFTRAFDFGFSKTRTETAAMWNEQAVLEDMVRVIRAFRPLVIYSRFTGTPADGHGHHQEAGYLTPLAFAAAANPSAFPELAREGLRPWQARKLYTSGRGDAAGAIVQVATGALDPVIGRTYAEIAAEGRSQHKSQGMGTIEPLGPATASLRLLQSRASAADTDRSAFDGLDVTITGIGSLAGLPQGALRAELQSLDRAARDAGRTYDPLHPEALLPMLADGVRAVRAARTALRQVTASADAIADADFLLADKEDAWCGALAQAAGVTVDPLASEETIVPGNSVDVSVRVFAANPALVRVAEATVRTPPGWTSSPIANPRETGGFQRETPTHTSIYRLTVPAAARPTAPYFLAQPRTGAMYQWSADAPKTQPFGEPLLTALVTLDNGGVTVPVRTPVVFRFSDPVRGELRRNVAIVPPVAVGFTSTLFVLPTGDAASPQTVQVQTTDLQAAPVTGVLSLAVPPGWKAMPATVPFTLGGRGAHSVATFTVTPPARRSAGRYEVQVQAAVGASQYTQDVQEIAYPHIQTHRIYSMAATTMQVIDLAVAPVRIGYITGSGDQVPDALRRMHLDVTMLDDAALAGGDLSAFDTIVVGIRASEARPAFVANQARLREFMERGGTLIVQYQQQQYIARGLPPYPAEMMGNSRVTDETAPVSILAPRHPAFTFPNRITSADFDGWVQERDLYSFTSFDPRYTPLLETADPGEMPQRGGEVYAQVGRGHYVYTSFAWFRQLPAGVPGAYRLFANLVSLPKAPAARAAAARSVRAGTTEARVAARRQ
jgi:LmbE family N-acetylglucosaminyl deacetylase